MYRQKEEEEKRNKIAALTAVKAAKAAVSVNMIVPEMKELPSIMPCKDGSPMRNDKAHKDM